MAGSTRLLSPSIVRLDQFIQSTRDSGYRSTVSAVSELVDNALEANADNVFIEIFNAVDSNEICVVVSDDGDGMSPTEIREALRFGGSGRFNSRQGMGRFGMGLPNASFSQCKRVDVFSWQNGRTFHSYLDVDEIIANDIQLVPKPVKDEGFIPLIELQKSHSGTSIRWSKCDRLDNKRITTLASKLRRGLGQQFRHYLWGGKKIFINQILLAAIDPLFLKDDRLPEPAVLFDEIEIPFKPKISSEGSRSLIKARFSQIPVEKLSQLSNEAKNKLGITNGAGVSIVRAQREIDYRWIFMGKRKENYDAWWRAEVSFDPVLDEYFGVTHTKQSIRPSVELTEILNNQFGPIARSLNQSVRETSIKLKLTQRLNTVTEQAEHIDHKFPKIAKRVLENSAEAEAYLHANFPQVLQLNKTTKMLYHLLEDNFDESFLYRPYCLQDHLIVVLNKRHPFYKKIYRPLKEECSQFSEKMIVILDTLFLSAARAENQLELNSDARALVKFRAQWGVLLNRFMQAERP